MRVAPATGMLEPPPGPRSAAPARQFHGFDDAALMGQSSAGVDPDNNVYVTHPGVFRASSRQSCTGDTGDPPTAFKGSKS